MSKLATTCISSKKWAGGSQFPSKAASISLRISTASRGPGGQRNGRRRRVWIQANSASCPRRPTSAKVRKRTSVPVGGARSDRQIALTRGDFDAATSQSTNTPLCVSTRQASRRNPSVSVSSQVRIWCPAVITVNCLLANGSALASPWTMSPGTTPNARPRAMGSAPITTATGSGSRRAAPQRRWCWAPPRCLSQRISVVVLPVTCMR